MRHGNSVSKIGRTAREVTRAVRDVAAAPAGVAGPVPGRGGGLRRRPLRRTGGTQDVDRAGPRRGDPGRGAAGTTGVLGKPLTPPRGRNATSPGVHLRERSDPPGLARRPWRGPGVEIVGPRGGHGPPTGRRPRGGDLETGGVGLMGFGER